MRLFQVVVATQAIRTVNVVAETAEEAQAKVNLVEGEAVVESKDEGEVIQ